MAAQIDGGADGQVVGDLLAAPDGDQGGRKRERNESRGGFGIFEGKFTGAPNKVCPLSIQEFGH